MKLPIIFQRIEGLSIALGVSVFYFLNNGNAFVFAVTIILVDFFMIGYLFDKKLGAIFYNLGHSYTISVILWFLSLLDSSNLLLGISAAWIAHIGIDRAFGFGLKHTTGFHDTHLGRIGKK